MGDFISGAIFLVAILGIGYLVVKRIMKKREDRANRPPSTGNGVSFEPSPDELPEGTSTEEKKSINDRN